MRADNPRARILILDPIDENGIDCLRKVADVDVLLGKTSADILLVVHRYEALVVQKTPITEEILRYGLRLKVIGVAGANLSNIDVTAARERDIAVVSAPDANTLAVAEHTLALMLALARRLPQAFTCIKDDAEWDTDALFGIGLAGRTLGVVGFGRIGSQVAMRAQAFGMKILVNQDKPTPELALAEDVEEVDLDDLLRRSDFVTLHVPLTEQTRGMVSAEKLSLMSPTSYLLNTARGEIIDETALLAALNAGRLAGAALDVFSGEIADHRELIAHPSVIATPHIAAGTKDARKKAALDVAEHIVELLEDMEIETVLPLRVVAMSKIFPHEAIDQRRVNRLAGRLQAEGLLSNPPLVMEAEDGYMVLDGATRTAALKQVGLPHCVVQVVPSDDNLALRTWFHVIRGHDLEGILALLAALPMIEMRETDPDSADDEMFEYGGLCYLRTKDDRAFMVFPAVGVNRLDALNLFADTYISASHVSRTLERNIIKLRYEYDDMTALVVYPEYTPQQVMQVAQAGKFFPAGITRFLIPGRVLRLNAPLDYLMSDRTLRVKNRWLHKMLTEKQEKGSIRYYNEPIYLLDE